jgi:hypothetical protein
MKLSATTTRVSLELFHDAWAGGVENRLVVEPPGSGGLVRIGRRVPTELPALPAPPRERSTLLAEPSQPPRRALSGRWTRGGGGLVGRSRCGGRFLVVLGFKLHSAVIHRVVCEDFIYAAAPGRLGTLVNSRLLDVMLLWRY